MEKEREERGRREGEGRRRGGGEIRKGLVIGGMVIGLLMGCNNGLAEELAVEKRLGEIGRSTENVFYSFIDLIAGTLGFAVKADTTKDKVGEHFSKLGGKVGDASKELEKVAEKAVVDGDKDGLLSKAIKEAVDVAKTTLSALKGHLKALKDIGDSNPVGWTANSGQGVAADSSVLKKVHQALTGIVTIAKKEGVEDLKEGKLTLEQASIGGTNSQHGAKVLATKTGNPGAGDSGKAAVIVSAVTGEEILDAIVKSKEGDADSELGGSAAPETSALKFAKGGTDGNLSTAATPKAAAVAGGIALRSLVKDGKLASQNSNQDEKAVQSAGITAVYKLVGAVEDIIKETVKKVLDKAKGEIDKARDSKTTVSK